MKVYMLTYCLFDDYMVYDEFNRLFKTFEAANAVMEKDFKEKYSEYAVDIKREDYIRATGRQFQVCFTISEKELEG